MPPAPIIRKAHTSNTKTYSSPSACRSYRLCTLKVRCNCQYTHPPTRPRHKCIQEHGNGQRRINKKIRRILATVPSSGLPKTNEKRARGIQLLGPKQEKSIGRLEHNIKRAVSEVFDAGSAKFAKIHLLQPYVQHNSAKPARLRRIIVIRSITNVANGLVRRVA